MGALVAARTLDEILLKEAVYTAFGQSSQQLSKLVPFGDWLDRHLIPDATSTDPT